VESFIAPWASEAARARLAVVEATLPSDPAQALEAAARAAHDHARRLEEDCLQLYAGTNVPSPLVSALHESALTAQPSMGYPGAKYQAGLEPIDVVEVTAAAAIARLMGAAFAEVRPTSATLANLAVYSALTEPEDTIAVLPDWAGGHLSHHAVGVPGVRGLRVAPLPYDAAYLDVALHALDAFLGWEFPRLVVVGASLMLFPHRLPEIAEIVRGHGIPLLYDASHVAGLIAEGRFQVPLREGADLVTFSTYKSFGGPPGGAIVTNDPRPGRAGVECRLPGAGGQLRRLPPRPPGRRRPRTRALRRRLRRRLHRQRPGPRRRLGRARPRRPRRRPRLHRIPPRRDRRPGRRCGAGTRACGTA
jgi:glycine hydroxymethyltransferase